MHRYLLLLIIVPGLAAAAHAGEDSLQELQDRCETAREARLAPERQALIQTCIQEQKKSPEKCERFYADYGAGGRAAGGGARVRLYNDLPECEALYKAEKASSGR